MNKFNPEDRIIFTNYSGKVYHGKVIRMDSPRLYECEFGDDFEGHDGSTGNRAMVKNRWYCHDTVIQPDFIFDTPLFNAMKEEK